MLSAVGVENNTTTTTNSDANDDVDSFQIDTVLSTLLTQLDAAEDAVVLSEISAAEKTLLDLRRAQSDDALNLLKNLSRELEAAKRAKEAAEAARIVNQNAHNLQMSVLENEKFGMAKKIHEEEKSLAALEARKRELTAELEELQIREEAEAARPPDESILKLAIYKNLGIDLVYEDGQIVRCLVRSVDKKDISVLELQDTKYSNFFYSNILWTMNGPGYQHPLKRRRRLRTKKGKESSVEFWYLRILTPAAAVHTAIPRGGRKAGATTPTLANGMCWTSNMMRMCIYSKGEKE
ncbi:kinetochore-associated Ndc80 complex subunit spc24 [Physocladia obscura]|uniref:Kinetochore protein Spc24 n=1 Tax=Physocladia obscura TaxID=109957 RepID=A0AAD5SVY8_9FUNG|nr:kinetochore-associated Ndc80 complex subunit spc24 [Physocladia obscura]